MALLCLYGFSLIGGSALLLGASTTSALARGGGGHGFGGGGFHGGGFRRGGFRGSGSGPLPLLRLRRILALLRRRRRLLCGSAARQDPLWLANPPRLDLRVIAHHLRRPGPAEAVFSAEAGSARRSGLIAIHLSAAVPDVADRRLGPARAEPAAVPAPAIEARAAVPTDPVGMPRLVTIRSARVSGSRARSRSRASDAPHAACHAPAQPMTAVADNSKTAIADRTGEIS